MSAAFTADFTQFVGAAKTAEVALDKVEGAAGRVVPSVHNLRGALSTFDGVLASMGVNIGTEIRGLTELGEASGKTFTQLGLVATAGLAAGAALGGWKLGRLIAEFFDLDKAIGSATAKMLGWGDLVGAEAGAKQDTINAAIRRGADATINYADAISFNTKKVQENQAALKEKVKTDKEAEDSLKKLIAEQERWALIMGELNTAGVNWFATLRGIDGEVVEAVKFYLNAGVAQSTLATAYALTAVQVKAVATAMSEELAMAKLLQEINTSAAANQAVLDARAMASIEAKTQKIREATAAAIEFNRAFLQNALDTALAQDAALFGGGVDTSILHSGQRGPGVNQGGSVPFSGVSTGAGASRFSLNASLPHFASGGPVLRDGPIFAHAGEFVVPKGGGPNVVIYVNGTEEEVARKVAAEVMRTVMSGTKVR